MADKQSDTRPPFDPNAYLASQAEEVAQRHAPKPPKRVSNPEEEVTFLTKPFTVVKNDSSFEMRGKGAPAVLTGPRPKRPDAIIRGEDTSNR